MAASYRASVTSRTLSDGTLASLAEDDTSAPLLSGKAETLARPDVIARYSPGGDSSERRFKRSSWSQ
jgi:hypothetical protein